MPNFFVVGTKFDTPKLYISQKTLHDTIHAAQLWSNTYEHIAHVFQVAVLPAYGQLLPDPMECRQLMLAAVTKPGHITQLLRCQLGDALDNLPLEQACEEAQIAVDYFSKRLMHFEETLKTPEKR